MAVSLTNFLDSGCIVASSLALTAWAAAFNFGSAWTAILGAIGANAFGAAVGRDDDPAVSHRSALRSDRDWGFGERPVR